MDQDVFNELIETAQQQRRFYELNWDGLPEPLPLTQFSQPSASNPKTAPVSNRRRWLGQKFISLMTAAAIVLLVAAMGLWWQEPANKLAMNQPAAPAPTVAQSTSVAFVTSEIDARWEDGPAGNGGVLEQGKAVHLRKGFARIHFASGVEVTLQGPAYFRANGRNAAEIRAGRLTADVPSQAVGFTVKTPNGLITDYGTEFGVAVDESGAVETHVFTGEVTFSAAASDQVITLRTGDAVRAASPNQVERRAMDPTVFVRQNDFNGLLAQQESAYKRWLAYSRELRRDQAMVAYYAFSVDDELAGQLHNVAEVTGAGLHSEKLSSAGSSPTWERGRFPQKRGLRFDRTKPQWVAIPYDERLNPGEAITIACWINRAGEGDRSGIFVSKLDALTEGYSYQLGGFDGRSPGNARGMQFATSAANVGARTSSPVFDPAPDRWEHVAATYDGSTVRFYYNGQPAGSEPMSLQMSDSKSDLFIGRDAVQAAPQFNPFGGVMDELVILSRAMSADEIGRMYEQGLPVEIQTD